MNVIKETRIMRIYPVKEWKKYFGERKYVSIEELIKFNAIFNATPMKKHKKRRENIKNS